MNKELFIKAISRFSAGLLLMMGLLFIPAGTWKYPQGWLLIGILFTSVLSGGARISAVTKNEGPVSGDAHRSFWLGEYHGEAIPLCYGSISTKRASIVVSR